MIQAGEKHRGSAQGPFARAKMLEGRGNIAFGANPVADLTLHEPTLAMGL
jgi:hypothetical protein